MRRYELPARWKSSVPFLPVYLPALISCSPVVYPAQGSKRATVDWIDLERLDEGEFLNDNLISFYLRYVLSQSFRGKESDVIKISRA